MSTSNGPAAMPSARSLSLSLSLVFCLTVCRSGWEQLWHTQRAVGQEGTNTDMHDQRLNEEATLMNIHKMHWQIRHITTGLRLTWNQATLTVYMALFVSVSHRASRAARQTQQMLY